MSGGLRNDRFTLKPLTKRSFLSPGSPARAVTLAAEAVEAVVDLSEAEAGAPSGDARLTRPQSVESGVGFVGEDAVTVRWRLEREDEALVARNAYLGLGSRLRA